ncbi:SIMPL domain-containing protein [soil metagenome]
MRTVLAAAVIGLSLIIAFYLISHAYKYKFISSETISVTGLAEKDFVSDLIVWNGSYSKKYMELRAAYTALKADEIAVRKYLQNKGISENEMIFSSVEINKEFDTRTDENGRTTGQIFTGYNLKQNITIESSDVAKVEKLSREATELIESGIEFNSSSPSYFNTKLSEVKMDLLAKASADARARAEAIAKNAGSSLGKLKTATMGVFQITGKNSNEDYSYGGAFNTSNKLKTGSITIRMEFTTD